MVHFLINSFQPSVAFHVETSQILVSNSRLNGNCFVKCVTNESLEALFPAGSIHLSFHLLNSEHIQCNIQHMSEVFLFQLWTCHCLVGIRTTTSQLVGLLAQYFHNTLMPPDTRAWSHVCTQWDFSLTRDFPRKLIKSLILFNSVQCILLTLS